MKQKTHFTYYTSYLNFKLLLLLPLSLLIQIYIMINSLLFLSSSYSHTIDYR